MDSIQKILLIKNGREVIQNYKKECQKTIDELGYFMNNSNYMVAHSKKAFAKTLKTDKFETNFNEICEIFDEIKENT